MFSGNEKKRYITELSFILSISILSVILFFNVIIYKTEFYGIDKNPVYNSIQWIMIGCLFIFNFSVLKYKVWANLLLTLMISALSVTFTDELYREIANIYPQVNNTVIPLGWQYKWFGLLISSLILVLLNEMSYFLFSKYLKIKNR